MVLNPFFVCFVCSPFVYPQCVIAVAPVISCTFPCMLMHIFVCKIREKIESFHVENSLVKPLPISVLFQISKKCDLLLSIVTFLLLKTFILRVR